MRTTDVAAPLAEAVRCRSDLFREAEVLCGASARPDVADLRRAELLHRAVVRHNADFLRSAEVLSGADILPSSRGVAGLAAAVRCAERSDPGHDHDRVVRAFVTAAIRLAPALSGAHGPSPAPFGRRRRGPAFLSALAAPAFLGTQP
jgi:hypothetical protein